MNTKRQTVWLVSMLSIMVVLSAYYLFTSDVDGVNTDANDDLTTQDIVLESSELEFSDVEGDQDVIFMDELTQSETNKTDEEIIKEVQSQQESGYGYFTNMHLERDEAFAEELENLLAVTVSGTAEDEIAAHDQIYQLEDKIAKLSHIEDVIMTDFANAIIQEEEANKWKVLVKTDKMEKSQAASIFDMVMKELEVGPDQVTVVMSP